jgi:hypothetical protein
MLLIAVYFLSLKINHDSHEFILESGTVVNNTVFGAISRSAAWSPPFAELDQQDRGKFN